MDTAYYIKDCPQQAIPYDHRIFLEGNTFERRKYYAH